MDPADLDDKLVTRLVQLLRSADDLFKSPDGGCLSPLGEYNLNLGIQKVRFLCYWPLYLLQCNAMNAMQCTFNSDTRQLPLLDGTSQRIFSFHRSSNPTSSPPHETNPAPTTATPSSSKRPYPSEAKTPKRASPSSASPTASPSYSKEEPTSPPA